MGYREYDVRLPSDYTDGELKAALQKKSRLKDFTYAITRKSLDARKKHDICWQVRAAVFSPAYPDQQEAFPVLEIPRLTTDQSALVVGSGPAGFFAALTLQKAGFDVTLIERGCDVEERSAGISDFEAGGSFHPDANYAFGEGGAGTFSDGKLTSRSKHIKPERQFILETYISAGAPEEIRYLAHPHLGTDNLKVIVRNLREQFTVLGGTILFKTMLDDITVRDGGVTLVSTSAGVMEPDHLIIAPGHSSYETYRMLIRRGVPFRNKNFAIGSRVEHPQELINLAQWGVPSIRGVKAAEYRLTSQADEHHPVYTFCMCPGGTVVPATAYAGQNIVNGMSRYRRNGRFANAACVAGLQIEELLGREVSPLEALDWLEQLEASAFEATGYRAPAVSIRDFLSGNPIGNLPDSSYPLGLQEYPLWELLPGTIVQAMRTGLKDFSRKLKGYDRGLILGLETKTSGPVQVLREQDGRVSGFSNLYLIGEGSGYAGGIISSAADGVKAVMAIAYGQQ